MASPHDLINAEHSKKLDTGDRNALLPGFHRRRPVPSLHQVATGKVDRELMMHRATSYHGLFGDLSSLKRDKEDEKGDTWNRLGELETFALFGFGFFKTLIGDGDYNKERMPTAVRQSATERGKY